MSGMRARLIAPRVLVLALFAASCRSSLPPPPHDKNASASAASARPGLFTEEELALSFAPHEKILRGFDARAAEGATGEWRIGDQALFGLRLDDGEDSRSVWFVRAEVMSGVVPYGEPLVFEAGPEKRPTLLMPRTGGITFTKSNGEKVERTSGSIALEVTVYDGSANEVGRSFVGAPARFLRDGFHASCARVHSLSPEIPETEREAALADVFMTIASSFLGFLETFKTSPHLESLRADVADTVVATPSIFSMIFGVSLSINPDFTGMRAEDRPLPARVPGDDAVRFPTDLRLNDKLATTLDLAAIEPRPPFHVAAGVIGLEAANPSDPAARFAARLLAAKRGPVPTEP